MSTIFVKPRHHYDSYQGEFWPLVELSGYDVVHPDEVDWLSNNVYICSPLNGEHNYGWAARALGCCTVCGADHTSDDESPCDALDDAERTCHLIHWNLERDPSRPPDPRFDEEWRSDRWYAEQGARVELARVIEDAADLHENLSATDAAAVAADRRTPCRYVTLGTHPDLARGTGEIVDGFWRRPWIADLVDVMDKQYDVIHLSAMSHRRQHIIPKLAEEMGWKVAPASAWGEERHRLLLQSKAMLAIHQDEHPIIEPLRYALAAAYGLPIIGEWSEDFHPWTSTGELKKGKVTQAIETQDPDHKYRLIHGLVAPPIDEYLFRDHVDAAVAAFLKERP